MTPKERKEAIAFIKRFFPIGSEVWESTCSAPLRITKRTVFEAIEFEYNDKMRPDLDKDREVDFYAHEPGKYTRRYSLKFWPKKWFLKKYIDEENKIREDRKIENDKRKARNLKRRKNYARRLSNLS